MKGTPDIDLNRELTHTRRSFLNTSASGLGGVALASMLQNDGLLAATGTDHKVDASPTTMMMAISRLAATGLRANQAMIPLCWLCCVTSLPLWLARLCCQEWAQPWTSGPLLRAKAARGISGWVCVVTGGLGSLKPP